MEIFFFTSREKTPDLTLPRSDEQTLECLLVWAVSMEWLDGNCSVVGSTVPARYTTIYFYPTFRRPINTKKG